MKNHFIQINDFSNAYIGVKGDKESVNRFLEMVETRKFATELSMFEDLPTDKDYDDEPKDIYQMAFKEPIIGSFSYCTAIKSITNFINNEIHDVVKPNIAESPTIINTLLSTSKSGWKDLIFKDNIDLYLKDGSFYRTEVIERKESMFIISFLIRHEMPGKNAVKEDFNKIKELLKLYSNLISGVEIYISTHLEPTFYVDDTFSSKSIIEYDTDAMEDNRSFAIYSTNQLWAATAMQNVKDDDGNESFCRFIV